MLFQKLVDPTFRGGATRAHSLNAKTPPIKVSRSDELNRYQEPESYKITGLEAGNLTLLDARGQVLHCDIFPSNFRTARLTVA